MDALKEIFGEKSLTYEELTRALTDKGIKLADLSGGDYVNKDKYKRLEEDYKKQLEEKGKELETLKAQGDNSAQMQVMIDALEKEKADLEAKQRETGVQLDRLTRRDLASSKTGIHDPDFLDLMQARYGEQKIDEFEKSVVAYAEANKQKWSTDNPSPDLNGEPNAKQDDEAAFTKLVMEAAGVKTKTNTKG